MRRDQSIAANQRPSLCLGTHAGPTDTAKDTKWAQNRRPLARPRTNKKTNSNWFGVKGSLAQRGSSSSLSANTRGTETASNPAHPPLHPTFLSIPPKQSSPPPPSGQRRFTKNHHEERCQLQQSSIRDKNHIRDKNLYGFDALLLLGNTDRAMHSPFMSRTFVCFCVFPCFL